MIEVVLFEGKHFIVILLSLIPSFQILLIIEYILDIFIEDVHACTFLFYYLVDFVAVKISLRRRIFTVEQLRMGERRKLHLLKLYFIDSHR